MDGKSIGGLGNSIFQISEEEMELRRGPWTVEEDLLLVNYIADHGEGRWNALARCAGTRADDLASYIVRCITRERSLTSKLVRLC